VCNARSDWSRPKTACVFPRSYDTQLPAVWVELGIKRFVGSAENETDAEMSPFVPGLPSHLRSPWPGVDVGLSFVYESSVSNLSNRLFT